MTIKRTMRQVDEWIGETPDTKIPPRVRLRVFETWGGVCGLSGRKIMPGDKWQIDHRIALALGGEHREANMWPVLVDAHKEKTKRDVAAKSKVARIRKKHLGIWTPKSGRKIAKRANPWGYR